ncbi:hypothetical protein GQX74_003509 [Glossina fuscipes]|nr:hypothetical protein GQX74_003509 [Glossina fuscipes]
MQLLAMKNNNNLKSKREDAAQNAHKRILSRTFFQEPSYCENLLNIFDRDYGFDHPVHSWLSKQARFNLTANTFTFIHMMVAEPRSLVFYYTVNILSLALHYVHVICEENAKTK